MTSADNHTPSRETFRNEAGESFSILRFPFQEGRPLLHWAHATGFSAGTYLPFLHLLAPHFNLLAWDMRGHGQTRAAADPGKLRNWQVFYDDLAALVGAQSKPMILAGHSVGAVASLAVAARMPARVSALILVDPILMNGVFGHGFGLAKRFGQGRRHPLVPAARRRRSSFPDRAAALRQYAGKQLFRRWQPGFLEAYVQDGFETRGGALHLRCAPAWEAAQFATTEHDPWPWLRRAHGPVLLVEAAQESTMLPGAAARFRRARPHTVHRRYEDATHMLPMEQPGRLFGDILAFLNVAADSGPAAEPGSGPLGVS